MEDEMISREQLELRNKFVSQMHNSIESQKGVPDKVRELLGNFRVDIARYEKMTSNIEPQKLEVSDHV